MSCSNPVFTTSIECCVLSILCNGVIVDEFILPQTRVYDRGDSFSLRDNVHGRDFSNAEIDITADEVRAARCACGAATAAAKTYTFALKQNSGATDDPSVIEYQNTTGMEWTWARASDGVYTGTASDTGFGFNIAETYVAYQMHSTGVPPHEPWYPVGSFGSGQVVGYYNLIVYNNVIEVRFVDDLFAPVDMYSRVSNGYLMMPKIEIYPNAVEFI